MALFQTSDEFKEHFSGVWSGIQFDNLKTHIEKAEKKFLKPLLSAAEYNSLVANYPGSLTASQTALLPYVQKSLAYYTIYLAAPFLNVSIGSTGLKESYTQDTQPASKWKNEELRQSSIDTADMLAEDMLEFMEDNKADYSDWAASSAYTETKNYFLNTTLEFHEHVRISESRRTFLALVPHMRRAESMHIESSLCSDLFEKLKGDKLSDSLAAKYAILWDKLKPAVAHFTVFEAIPSISLKITENGILINSIGDSYTKSNAADKRDLQNLKDDSLRNGRHYLRKAIEYIEKADNIDDFPEYKNSDCYSEDATTSCNLGDIDNSNSSNFAL